jgi:hypothetical protein
MEKVKLVGKILLPELPKKEKQQPQKLLSDFPRAEDDGRCLCCEGWGCVECDHTGGY